MIEDFQHHSRSWLAQHPLALNTSACKATKQTASYHTCRFTNTHHFSTNINSSSICIKPFNLEVPWAYQLQHNGIVRGVRSCLRYKTRKKSLMHPGSNMRHLYSLVNGKATMHSCSLHMWRVMSLLCGSTNKQIIKNDFGVPLIPIEGHHHNLGG